MRLAVERAREGIRKGQTPFGACIVRPARLPKLGQGARPGRSSVVACAHNGVWAATDITAHAEIVAIREACRRLKTIDLSGCVIYSTCEPCPMCFSACHWARIKRIVYGAAIADAQAAGFNELAISNSRLKALGRSPMKIRRGVLRKECREMFEEWRRSARHAAY